MCIYCLLFWILSARKLNKPSFALEKINTWTVWTHLFRNKINASWDEQLLSWTSISFAGLGELHYYVFYCPERIVTTGMSSERAALCGLVRLTWQSGAGRSGCILSPTMAQFCDLWSTWCLSGSFLLAAGASSQRCYESTKGFGKCWRCPSASAKLHEICGSAKCFSSSVYVSTLRHTKLTEAARYAVWLEPPLSIINRLAMLSESVQIIRMLLTWGTRLLAGH